MAKAEGKSTPNRRRGVAQATGHADGFADVAALGGQPTVPLTAQPGSYAIVQPNRVFTIKPRSRKPRSRGHGRQTIAARTVLKRIFRDGYPTKAEVSNAELWDRFVREWDRVEGKKPPTKFNTMPSRSVVLREVGRK